MGEPEFYKAKEAQVSQSQKERAESPRLTGYTPKAGQLEEIEARRRKEKSAQSNDLQSYAERARQNYESRANKADAREFKEGDVLDCTWVYTASMPEFWVVTSNNGKTVKAVRLEQTNLTDDGYGQNGTSVPNGRRVGEEKSFRIKRNGTIEIEDVRARLWDGRARHFYTD